MPCKKDRRMLCGLVLFALFGVQITMHMNVDNLLLDDWVFFAPLELGESVTAYLANRWQTWSSRLIIEGALCLLTHSIWTFRVLDSAVMVVMAWGLCRMANAEKRGSMLALAACLVTTIPFTVLRSTGWMATSLNYYWTMTAAVVALIPMTDSLWRRETGGVLTAIAIACAVFGANQEQMSAVLAGSYLVLGAYRLKRDGRVSAAQAAIFAIAVAELVIHLICPGNAIRSEQSIAIVNLRDYGQFSMVDKLASGLTSTATLLLFTRCPVLLACGAVVASTVIARRRGAAAYLLMLPVAAVLLGKTLRGAMPEDITPGWIGMLCFGEFSDYAMQLGPARIGPLSLLTLMKVIVVLGLMALALYLSIGHRPLAVGAVLAFAVGFAARMTMSFSPTVVESGERTMLPLYGAMMLCALLCMRNCGKDSARRLPMALAFGICLWLAAANALGSFALAA